MAYACACEYARDRANQRAGLWERGVRARQQEKEARKKRSSKKKREGDR